MMQEIDIKEVQELYNEYIPDEELNLCNFREMFLMYAMFRKDKTFDNICKNKELQDKILKIFKKYPTLNIKRIKQYNTWSKINKWEITRDSLRGFFDEDLRVEEYETLKDWLEL